MKAVNTAVGAPNADAPESGAFVTQVQDPMSDMSPAMLEPGNLHQTESNAQPSWHTAVLEEPTGVEEQSEPENDTVDAHHEATDVGIGTGVAGAQAHVDERMDTPDAEVPDESARAQEGAQAQVRSWSVKDASVSCTRVATALGAYRLHSVKPV
jgi:hypothetical protein